MGRNNWTPRDESSPHEAAGHRWAFVPKIHSVPNEEGELYPVYHEQECSERGSEGEENTMRANFQRHLRQGHSAERIIHGARNSSGR
jgi:hypothetical protein